MKYGCSGAPSFYRLFYLQISHKLAIASVRFVSPNAPRIACHAGVARWQMPEPAQIAAAKNPAQRVKNRADKSDAINRRQPNRNGRFFLHPICFRLFLHAEKMHGGAASFFYETPKRLHIIMM